MDYKRFPFAFVATVFLQLRFYGLHYDFPPSAFPFPTPFLGSEDLAKIVFTSAFDQLVSVDPKVKSANVLLCRRYAL